MVDKAITSRVEDGQILKSSANNLLPAGWKSLGEVEQGAPMPKRGPRYVWVDEHKKISQHAHESYGTGNTIQPIYEPILLQNNWRLVGFSFHPKPCGGGFGG